MRFFLPSPSLASPVAVQRAALQVSRSPTVTTVNGTCCLQGPAARTSQRRLKSSNRTPSRRPGFQAPEIIIPPTFSDGQIPKAKLRLTREEAAARAARLANPAIIDQLRAEGRFSRAHWRFNHDPVRATPRQILKGPSHSDAYRITNLKFWLKLPLYIKGKVVGTMHSWSAYWSEDVMDFLSSDGGVVDMLRKTVKPALEALSYSPNDHARWQSANTRSLFTPTMYARLNGCTSVLRSHGDLQFKLSITEVRGLDRLYRIRRFLLIGDSHMVSGADLLGPRVVLLQLGRMQTIANLEYDVDSVPSWQQFAYVKDYASDQLYGQCLIDVPVRISGTATIERVPPPSARPLLPPNLPLHATRGGKPAKRPKHPPAETVPPLVEDMDTSPIRIEEDRVVYEESFFNRPMVIRMASTPFPLVRNANRDYPINVNAPWRVADIDYLTSSLLVERAKKLAPYLASLRKP